MNNEDKLNLKKELETQDNIATADPLYCVYEEYEQVVPEDCGEDGHKWYFDCETYTDEDVIEWYKDNKYKMIGDLSEDELSYKDDNEEFLLSFKKYFYKMLPRFVQPFFTEKAAQLYIDQNDHNLTKPYIYVHGLYRNYEMIDIRNHFMEVKK